MKTLKLVLFAIFAILCLYAVLPTQYLIAQTNKSGSRDKTGSRAKDQVHQPIYFVTKVIDGDTFWVQDISGNEIKVRMIGIDAPELKKTNRKEVGRFAREAKNYLSKLILRKKIYLKFDIDKSDQYRRTLAYVFLPNGTFVNEKLVKEGYAMAMTVPPNVKYSGKFLMLQQQARNSRRGLWR